MNAAKLQRAVVVLLLALPAFLAFNYVYRFGVDVPYLDDWELITLISRADQGTLTLAELFGQHNEHRIFWPRIVMLLEASLLHYDTHWLMYLSWLMVMGTAALMLWQHVRTFGASTASLAAWLPAAWIVFSVRQHENWLWGWQVQFFMCAGGFVAAMHFLHTVDRARHRFFVALVFAGVTSFTIAGGMGVWPGGAALLLALHLLRNRTSGALHLKLLGGWLLAGAVATIAYAHGYVRNPYHPDPAFFTDHPLSALRYLLVALGAPFSYSPSAALTAGALLGGIL